MVFNNSITIQWINSTIQAATNVTLPLTYSSWYVPVCGGGDYISGTWPHSVKVDLSTVNIGSRGTHTYIGNSYCICIGY